MCLEGGCGACIVAVTLNNYTFSTNSCLVPIFLCNGWKVTTTEGIGSQKKGYSPIQSKLAELNGSQCGFCSPGMVMNMYSLVKSKKNLTDDIENGFGGNICRCTGYRPILDAFQSLSSPVPRKSINCYDIEDSHVVFQLPESCKTCKNSHDDFVNIEIEELEPIHLNLEGAEFFKVFSVDQIFAIFKKKTSSTYILNGGNTGNGVYRIREKDLYIDINGVHELHNIIKTDSTLTVGATTSLQTVIELFPHIAKHPGFAYLHQIALHVNLIGHVSMRNIGTIAGNLMLKHEHPEFLSDLFLILETVEAEIQILEAEKNKISMKLLDFLKVDMRHKVIHSIILKKLDSKKNFMSYKIMPVYQNAHAIMNAGFLLQLDTKSVVVEKPNIVFGNINPSFYHAEKTESFLAGKNIFNRNVLKCALDILYDELNPDYVLSKPTPQYRRILALSLFYKFLLSLQPHKISYKLRSGGNILKRNISSGVSVYNIDKSMWPLNKPLTKLEAIYQTSGEAIYLDDIPRQDSEVFCVMTLAPRPGKIKSIDYEDAMQMNGVVAFYSYKDIPSKNVCVNSQKPHMFISSDEPLFAELEVLYAGQPYGVIAATSQYKAFDAAQKVKLIYENERVTKPIITIQEVLSTNDQNRIRKFFDNPATKPAGKDVQFRISGDINVESQYHYTLEPQSCICIPIEGGMDVFVGSQCVEFLQWGIATCLGIPMNTINFRLKRVGGAYGCKITRPAHPACACALVAYKLNRPARLIMSIEDMMKSMGKRSPAYLHYDVGVNEMGKIQFSNLHYFSNEGYSFNDAVLLMEITKGLQNCYDYSTWNMIGYHLKTDLPCNTWCRAPGSCDGIAMIETIMEHIAKVTKKNPLQVRLENMNVDNKSTLQPIIDEITRTSDLQNRHQIVDKYNKYNRWKKKGIACTLMAYYTDFFGPFYALVSIFARDGTVSITHAGIEIGQGINTKVAQVAAYVLGIDPDLIKIRPFDSSILPNAQGTIGNVTSDCCTSATQFACKQLLNRLQPIREKLKNPTWQQLVFEAYNQGVDLCAVHQYSPKSTDPPNKPYVVYGAAVAEVEVDVLTGQHIVERVDILEDVGVSMNQKIDVGQIQGAFIMGLGRYTSEKLFYDPNTGALVNNRTWNYKPPGAQDIPVDFRINLYGDGPNPTGTLRSKNTGEPALCMSIVVPFAIRNALDSARSNAGNNDEWYEMDTTTTQETILLTSLTSKEGMTL
ncbi:xanthine dehydrogenase/oxidase-like [Copidosoma floridanum]|uniref:xanthine dehydrogenase/oxidase-like n=1 Tax=Copidosoma floridanum TaxID=29053 RepID=UPI000C6FA018|nr:xanthine dehydrogenase/oxidase-like [Copidosoma floridanum]